MQSVSNTYRTIFSGEHTAETRLDIYDKSGTNLVHSYGGADIVSLTTTRGLFKENNPCVGSTVSSEIDCDLFVGNYTIPRMAMLKPYIRLMSLLYQWQKWSVITTYFWNKYTVGHRYYWNRYVNKITHHWKKYAVDVNYTDRSLGNTGTKNYSHVNTPETRVINSTPQIVVIDGEPKYDFSSGRQTVVQTDYTPVGSFCAANNDSIKTASGGVGNYQTYYAKVLSIKDNSLFGWIASSDANSEIHYIQTTRSRGTYIEDVSSANQGSYPQDGEQDGFWYIYDGYTQERGTFIDSVHSNNQSAYPQDGAQGDYWYVYDKSEDCRGYLIEEVSGIRSDEYPQDGIQSGYWYVYDRSEQQKGELIDIVTSENANEHPQNGIHDGYWYVSLGRPVSEWLPKGVYWIDTRSTDYSSGVTTIHGYDAMLKGEQLFSPEQTVQDWPRTDLQVLNGCTISGRQHDGVAQKMGVTIQQSSLTLINKSYSVQYPGTTQGDGNIANGAMTVREVLGYICAMYGLNATIDEDGTMRFVPLASQTNVADIGQSVLSFDSIPAFDAFGQVEVVTSERESLFYPTTGSGRTLTLYSPWGVQTGKNVAQNVYNIVNGYVYRPFNAENAIIDPALQLGDGVTVNGVTSVLNVINSDFGRAFTASISAPQDDEVDHEYPYTDRNTREIERIAATTQASLVVMADQIEAKVSNDEMQSAITQTAGEILAEVASDYYGKQTSVSITPQGLTVNSDGSITLSAGATFTISSGNFSIDSSGNVRVAGTLSAAKVYASNVVTGSTGGNIGSASQSLNHLYANGATINTIGADTLNMGTNGKVKFALSGVELGGNSVVHGTKSRTWDDILDGGGSGGTAVFG